MASYLRSFVLLSKFEAVVCVAQAKIQQFSSLTFSIYLFLSLFFVDWIGPNSAQVFIPNIDGRQLNIHRIF